VHKKLKPKRGATNKFFQTGGYRGERFSGKKKNFAHDGKTKTLGNTKGKIREGQMVTPIPKEKKGKNKKVLSRACRKESQRREKKKKNKDEKKSSSCLQRLEKKVREAPSQNKPPLAKAILERIRNWEKKKTESLESARLGKELKKGKQKGKRDSDARTA